MPFSMPNSEKIRVAITEGVASSAQHLENVQHVTSVGPWNLRRGSSSSWVALNSSERRPNGRQRAVSNAIDSSIPSPGVRRSAALASNPFDDAFVVAMASDNPFHDRAMSNASRSTVVTSNEGEVETPATGRSELMAAMDEADRECEKARKALDEEKDLTSNDDVPQEGAPSIPQTPAPAYLPPTASAAADLERQAVQALHVVEPHPCQVCKRNSRVAKLGLWLLVLTNLLLWPCLGSFTLVKEEQWARAGFKLFFGLMTIPFAGAWGTSVLAWLSLLVLASPSAWGHLMKRRRVFFDLWLRLVCLGLVMYFVAGMVWYYAFWEKHWIGGA